MEQTVGDLAVANSRMVLMCTANVCSPHVTVLPTEGIGP